MSELERSVLNPDNILLESGTNELELLVFTLKIRRPGEPEEAEAIGRYGINVAKVREIIRPPDITAMPGQAASVVGVANIRGSVVPMIDLARAIGYESRNGGGRLAILTEFNGTRNGFLVHDVDRIHRISWQEVEPPSGMLQSSEKECMTSLVRLENETIVVLDFEKIVFEINPDMFAMAAGPAAGNGGGSRSPGKILLAEDSGFLRKMMVDHFEEAGYEIEAYENGKLAYDRLLEIRRKANGNAGGVAEHLNLVVTDIEMPQMDGLHLIKKIRETQGFEALPVIVFSSIANHENVLKWSSLGANGHVVKPELELLLEKIEEHIGKCAN